MKKFLLFFVLVVGLTMPFLGAGILMSRMEDSQTVESESESDFVLLEHVGDKERFALTVADGCPPGAIFSYLTKYPQDLDKVVMFKPIVIPLFFYHLTQMSEGDLYVRIGKDLWMSCVKVLYRPICEYLERHPEHIPAALEAAHDDCVKLELNKTLDRASGSAGDLNCMMERELIEL